MPRTGVGGEEGRTTLLMYACSQGDLHQVQRILHEQPNSTILVDRTHRTALHYCAGSTHSASSTHCADLLVMAAPNLVHARDIDGFTPLHLAVVGGNVPLVHFLLANGADVNAVDSEKHSVVHWATVCGETTALSAVLAAGAEVSTPDVHGGYPLHYAAQMCGSDKSEVGLQVLHILLSHKNVSVSITDNAGRPPLLWAASAGSARAVLALIRAGAVVESADKDGLTALHCAASRGHTDTLDALLTLCGASVDVIDENGCTALHYSVTLGHADATALLLSHSADPNLQDRRGRTPAHCGCARGQLETLRQLRAAGANLWVRSARGDLPLHEAAASGRRDLVQWLLDQRPSQVNARNNDGRSVLHLAAVKDNTDLCKILLDAGAQVNPILRTSKNVFMTPLDCALQRGFRSTAKFLQLHGGVPASRLNALRFNNELALTSGHLHIRDDVTVIGSSSDSDLENIHRAKDLQRKRTSRRKLSCRDKKHVKTLSDSEKDQWQKEKLPEKWAKSRDEGRRIKVRDYSKKSSKNNDISIKSDGKNFTKKKQNVDSGEASLSEMESSLEGKSGNLKIPIENLKSIEGEKCKRRIKNGKECESSDADRKKKRISHKSNEEKEVLESKKRDEENSSYLDKVKETESQLNNKEIKSKNKRLDSEIKKTTQRNESSEGNQVIKKEESDKEKSKRKTSSKSTKSEFQSENEKISEEKDKVDNHDKKTKRKSASSVDKLSTKSLKSEIESENESKSIKIEETKISEEKLKSKSDLKNNQAITSSKSEDDKQTEDKEEMVNNNEKQEKTIPTENNKSLSKSEAKEYTDINEEKLTKEISKSEFQSENESQNHSVNNLKKESISIQDEQKTTTTEGDEKQQIHSPAENTFEESVTLQKAKLEEMNDKSIEIEPDEISLQSKLSEESPSKIIVVEASVHHPPKGVSPEDEELKIFVEEDQEDSKDTNLKTNKDNKTVEENYIQDESKSEVVKKEINEEKIEESIPDDVEQTNNTQEIDTLNINEENVIIDTKIQITDQTEENQHNINETTKDDLSLEQKQEDNKETIETVDSTVAEEQKQEETKTKKELNIDLSLKKFEEPTELQNDASEADENNADGSNKKKVRKKVKISKTKNGKDGESSSTSRETSSSESETEQIKNGEHKSFKILHDEVAFEVLKDSTVKETRRTKKTSKKRTKEPERPNESATSSPEMLESIRSRTKSTLPTLSSTKRPDSNLSVPNLSSVFSDNDQNSEIDDLMSSGSRKKRFKRRSKLRTGSKSAGSDYESSNLIDSGFEPSPRSSRIPKRKVMSERGVNMTSVTQQIQSNIRKYHMERKIFQHLLDLKRLQIRSGQANEAMLVKRAIESYHNSVAATVGAGRYIKKDFTYKSFEQFLYQSLRMLQKSPVSHLKGLPEAPDNPLLCTQSTHRCLHATHAYTGIPCAAYLPKMNHHTIPKIGFTSKSTNFLPQINAKGKSVTLELCHGKDKQVISLPADRLDHNKRYYVTFTVKGQDSQSPIDQPDTTSHRHAKSV